MQRILVTGATGCTGRGALIYLISKGYENVYGMARKIPQNKVENVSYVVGDFTDKASIDKILRENKIKSIWHIGAAVHTNVKKKDFERVNFEGTNNIIQAAIDNGVTNIIFASSVSVYGILKKTPTPETHPIEPKGHYAKSKLNAEKQIKKQCEENDIKGSIVRFPIIMGKYDRHFFPVVGRFAKRNLLPIIGKANHKTAVVHPYDVAQAFEILEKSESKEVEGYNIVSCNCPFQELVETIEKHVVGKKRFKLHLPYFLIFLVFWIYEMFSWLFTHGKQPVVNREYARMIGKDWSFDISKLKQLGYTPSMTINDIVIDTISDEPFPVPK